MQDKDRPDKLVFPRDRDGEIYQDDLGEDHTANPPVRDDAAHDLNLKPDDVDSEESDEFMRKNFSTSENRPAPPRK